MLLFQPMRAIYCIGSGGVSLLLTFAGILAWSGFGLRPLRASEASFVWESPRRIPVAYETDVVVVGGTTGAVSAAVAAADAGASVFLAAPRPYLGEDLISPLQLWRDHDTDPKTPLARALMTDELNSSGMPLANRLAFTYTANQLSSPRHRDLTPPSRLADGRWGSAQRDSVQYDDSVKLTLDLGGTQPVRGIRVMAHHRDDSTSAVNYILDTITVDSSLDQTTWKTLATVQRTQTDRSFVLSIPCEAETRFLRLAIHKAPKADRILLGEIEVLGAAAIGDASVDPTTAQTPFRPMHVKKTLDDALLDSGVLFLYGCLPTDVIRDEDGMPCGIVMANRSGRQAVLAKVIIDATKRAAVAEMAGAKRRPWPTEPLTLHRVVIGTHTRTDPSANVRCMGHIGKHVLMRHTFQWSVADGRYATFSKLEQIARDQTYQLGQVRGAESLLFVRPDPIVAEKSVMVATGRPDEVELAACRPAGVSRLFVLGECIDLPRADARLLQDPVVAMNLGDRVGRAAARQAASLPSVPNPTVPGAAKSETPARDIREVLTGVRPTQVLPTIESGARRVPVLARYEVVVIGGGTSGAPAAIGAARQGVKTLVVEYQEGLGGMGTVGMVGHYHRGNRVGFTATVPEQGGDGRMEWWRQEARKAGADIWLRSLGCGAVVEGNRVVGAVVVCPDGRGVVLADTVIDATGNADIAIAAGAESLAADAEDIAVQGTGMPTRELDAVYTNTDYTLVDDSDTVDTWRILVEAKRKYSASYDLGTIVQTRERRRVVGDFIVTYLDQVAGRTYPDTVVESSSNYDSHGYPNHPFFAIVRPQDGERPSGGMVDTPYRCLLPRGLDGLLVVGLGMSADRDALALVRMQADLQNQGYAAGVAAAMAVQDNVTPRAIDVKKLQRHLVAMKNLPERVLTDQDSFPVSLERIATAVDRLKRDERPRDDDVAIVLTHPADSHDLLRAAWEEAEGESRITCALILAFCGDATGAETLMDALQRIDGWDAKKPLGNMAEYSQLPTRTDALILGLGYAHASKALPLLLQRAATLDATVCLSHHRAIAQALERLGGSEAARVLADVLKQPGMSGHAQTNLSIPGNRVEPLREIVLARALYHCGDNEGLGERILNEYANDLRGHFARHAKAILAQPKP